MPDLQEMLRDITANTQAMQQLMSLAQTFGGGGPKPLQSPGSPPPSPALAPQQNPMQLMQNLIQLSNQAGSLNQQQLALIQAIKPFLTPERAEKLERAIQVANLSQMASASLRQMGSQTPESR